MILETYHFTGWSYNIKITQEDLIRFNAAANSHCRTARTVIQLESLQATEASALWLDWQFSALFLCTDVHKSIWHKDSVLLSTHAHIWLSLADSLYRFMQIVKRLSLYTILRPLTALHTTCYILKSIHISTCRHVRVRIRPNSWLVVNKYSSVSPPLPVCAPGRKGCSSTTKHCVVA